MMKCVQLTFVPFYLYFFFIFFLFITVLIGLITDTPNPNDLKYPHS